MENNAHKTTTNDTHLQPIKSGKPQLHSDDIKHSQSDPIVGNGKYKSNYLIEGNAATLFPRPASTFLLQEQDSDEAEIDFSVEKEMLKNQIKKAEDSFNGKLQHENSNTSFLDECNEEDEAMIVRMLKEIDSNEGLKSE